MTWKVRLRRKWTFLSRLDLSEAINWQFSNPCPCGFINYRNTDKNLLHIHMLLAHNKIEMCQNIDNIWTMVKGYCLGNYKEQSFNKITEFWGICFQHMFWETIFYNSVILTAASNIPVNYHLIVMYTNSDTTSTIVV